MRFFHRAYMRTVLYRYAQISFGRRTPLDRDKARFVRSARTRWNAISSECTDPLSESSSLPRSCVQKGGIKTCFQGRKGRRGEKEKRSGFVRERNSAETECISRMPNSVLQNQLREYSLTLIKIFRREFSRGQYSPK